jgi:hypothetical protein
VTCALADVTKSKEAAPRGPVRFRRSVLLTKNEAFAACQALADADRCLVRAGQCGEADALCDLFELLEARMAAVDR